MGAALHMLATTLVPALLPLGCARALPPAGVPPTGSYIEQVEAGGRPREVRVHVPAGYDGTRALPLVIALHGAFATGADFEGVTGWSRLADHAHFVVAYPEGIGAPFGIAQMWNAGHCCGKPMLLGVDDVAFVRLAIERLSARLPVDPDRIFVTGFSNGAMLAHHVAAECSDLIAAVAPIAGSMATTGPAGAPSFDLVAPSLPVSVLLLHGTADERVPFAGADGGGPSLASFAQAARFWAVADGCSRQPVRGLIASGAVVEVRYEGCPLGTEVIADALPDWGHVYPGGRETAGLPTGHPLQGFDATAYIWRFFVGHPRRRRGGRKPGGPGAVPEASGR